MGRRIAAAWVLAAFALAGASAATPPAAKLHNPDSGNPAQLFGLSLGMDGDTMIVGAPSGGRPGDMPGAAWVYVRDGSGDWVLQTILSPDEGQADGQFGVSVAISGDLAVVGAWHEDRGAADTGAIYAFRRSNGMWTREASLTADVPQEREYFGYSIAMSGDSVIVGAPGAAGPPYPEGSAYIFTHSGNRWKQQAKLTVPSSYRLGTSVGISGDYAIVAGDGPSLGEAYIFARGGETWSAALKLDTSDLLGLDRSNYTMSVAIDNDTAVVGGALSNAVGVFGRDANNWTRQTTLTGDGVFVRGFGSSVAIKGDVLISGSTTDPSGEFPAYIPIGAAEVFKRSGGVWSAKASLDAPQPDFFIGFGGAVAVGDGAIAAGAPGFYSNGYAQGYACIYEQSGDSWPLKTELTGAKAAGRGYFGGGAIAGDTAVVPGGWGSGDVAARVYVRAGDAWMQHANLLFSSATPWHDFESAAMSGDTIIVGNNDDFGMESEGSALVYVRDGDGWSLQAQLISDDPAALIDISSVAISGDTAIAGTWSSGKVCVFIRSSGVWHQQAVLTDPGPVFAGNFGQCVAIDGDTIVAGALGFRSINGPIPTGTAAIFTRSGDAWIPQAQIKSPDTASKGRFGASVAISGDTILIGAYEADARTGLTGLACVYTRMAGAWSLQSKLIDPDGIANDHFGSSVAIQGDVAIIGASRNDTAATDAGAAFVFKRAGGKWNRLEELTAPDAAAGDLFGSCVALDGDRFFVGAPADDDPETDSGSAYLFDFVPSAAGDWMLYR